MDSSSKDTTLDDWVTGAQGGSGGYTVGLRLQEWCWERRY